MMKMQKKFNTYRWFLVAWLLFGCSYTMSFAVTYTSVQQSAEWAYRPMYTTMSSVSGLSYDYSCVQVIGKNECPVFQFRSTSPYTALMDSVSGGFTGTYKGPRRTNTWDEEPDDDPIGVVPNPLPVGEPIILLSMALLYIICLFYRQSYKK